MLSNVLLALLAEPQSMLAFLLLTFAAGMYPVGMFFGSVCGKCCAVTQPCNACTEGELPDTMTVTLDNYPGEHHGPALCVLSFSACYGSGATGFATAPGGYFDATDEHASNVGPLSALTLSGGGSGYAILGRVAPTLTASADTGNNASLTVVASTAKDACDVDYWSVKSVTINKAGTGAIEGSGVTIDIGSGDTAEVSAAATLHIVRTIPTLTATPTTGSGADLTVTMRVKNDYYGAPIAPAVWEIDEITFSAPGSGYEDESFATIGFDGDTTEVSPGDVLIRTVRTQPTISATFTGGSGAVFSLSLSYTSARFWVVTGVTVTNGGTGYTDGDLATIVLGTNDHLSSVTNDAALIAVVAGGVITGVNVNYGGGYYKGVGAIESVVAAYAGGGIPGYPNSFVRGEYYKSDGAIASISIENGGAYYHSSAEAEPYVAAVTVSISQTSPSNGTGAVIAAVVEDNTSSADFGKIKTLSVSAGGSGYLAWEWVKTCCDDKWNGVPIVLKRYLNNSGDPCEYIHRMCGGYSNVGSRGKISLQYHGPSSSATITMLSEIKPDGGPGAATECNVTIQSDSLITDCGDWSGITFSGTDPNGTTPLAAVVTATVEVGGEYDSHFLYDADCPYCESCCQGTDTPPTEVTVVFAVSGVGEAYANASAAAGTYVLSNDFNQCGLMYYTYSSGGLNGSFVVWLSSCKNDGCNTCISKCKTSISVPNFSRQIGYNNTDVNIGLADSRICCGVVTGQHPASECAQRELCNNVCTASTPVCTPQTGSYDLSAYYCNEMFAQVTPNLWTSAFDFFSLEPYYVNTVIAGATSCDHQNGFAAWARANKFTAHWGGFFGQDVYGFGIPPADLNNPPPWNAIPTWQIFNTEEDRDAWLDVLDSKTPSSWKDIASFTIQ